MNPGAKVLYLEGSVEGMVCEGQLDEVWWVQWHTSLKITY